MAIWRLVPVVVILASLLLPFSPHSATAAQLAGSEWRPTELDGVAVDGASFEVFVQFRGEGQVTGHGGCNRFFGSFEIDGDRIDFGPLATTRMACAQPVMDREQRFLSALQEAARFARDRIHLSLFDEAGNVIMRLIQTDAD